MGPEGAGRSLPETGQGAGSSPPYFCEQPRHTPVECRSRL